MNAYLLNEAGGVENLVLSKVEPPVLKPHEVLIQTKVLSINPVDVKARGSSSVLSWILGAESRPVILGWDLAGTVMAVGSNVTRFSVGEEVFGMINFPGQGKAYAEYVAASEAQLAKIPATVSFSEAAATTLAALTALQVLRGRVKAGDYVLIHAGSGGVGHFAIQMAKQMGAFVVTTSSEKNRAFCLSVGADRHIDYRKEAFEEELKDIDFVLDGMGGAVLENSLKVMRPGGKIVSLPTPEFPDGFQARADAKQVTVEFLLVESNGVDMEKLAAMLGDGSLTPYISKTFPFSELAAAHLQVESGRTVGKVIVTL